MANQIYSNIVLTETDRAILSSYKRMCDGLSDYLGSGYEFVLHSLEDLDHSVIKIINGHYTSRKEGSPITDLALNMLDKIQEENLAGYFSYSSRNRKGEPLRSTTITVIGENERVIGLLCINFYLNTPLSSVIDSLIRATPENISHASAENFVNNPSELIADAVEEVRKEVVADANITTQNRNKEIVLRLAARGIFRLKDSVVLCAELLGVSKNTIYMHLRNNS